MKNPELIHLLRLQKDFPNTAIARLMGEGSKPVGPGGAQEKNEQGIPMGFDAPAEKKDASTETPVHFIEKNIDPSYDWNEWGLRRRALQLANLRGKKTSSQQTDSSHMRRENDTQVYLPKTSGTMTKTSTGTNVERTVSYVRGLRGEEAKGEGKKPGVVVLSFETGVTKNVGQSSR